MRPSRGIRINNGLAQTPRARVVGVGNGEVGRKNAADAQQRGEQIGKNLFHVFLKVRLLEV